MTQHDIVIIEAALPGAGAGVAAKRAGAEDILILERDSRLGGILNQCIHNGFGLQRSRRADRPGIRKDAI